MDKLLMKYISPTIFAFSLQFILYSPLNSQTIPADSLYLGQIPPDSTPKIFNIPFSRAHPGDRIAISPDGKEIYYGELYPSPTMTTLRRIKYFNYSNGAWRGPSVLFDGFIAPALSISGDTLFFQKYENDHAYPYFSVRNDSGWSTPSRFMRGFDMHYLQITNSGNYYAGGISKIVVNGSDVSFHNLEIPSGIDDGDFFISRDESFIIIPSHKRGGLGESDFFISYRKNDSSWTNPKNLGSPINTKDYEHGPYVTTDNKYIIFLRSAGTWPVMYWARIDKVIDSLRHTNFAPYLKSQIPDQTDTVGSPFSFRIPVNTFFDDDGNNTLTYSAILSNGNPLPAWLSFSATQQIFSGTPTTADTISIKVTATDTANASVLCTFNLEPVNK